MSERMKRDAIDTALAETTRAQGVAADPMVSAWVSANAGTGKTHVLTTRVLRLMLAGTAPERILCLTYTKAAAAEMAKRVFDTLAGWVVADDTNLARKLTTLLGRDPTREEMGRARTLFTQAIETPGGLKVQTIHAFAERLLQRFPLEAGVTPGFAILDEGEARALRREAIDAVLDEAARDRAKPLGQALETAVVYAADDRFDEILTDALRHRAWLEATDPDETRAMLCARLGVAPDETLDSVEQRMASLLTDASLAALTVILSKGSLNDQKMSASLGTAVAARGASARVEALRDVFMTVSGTPRRALMTNGIAAANPDAHARLKEAQARFAALEDTHAALRIAAATVALHRLAKAVLARYADAKVRRAALDFDDLIVRTRALLSTSVATEWVLHKLDRGVDHILVDESQDTSPGQWQVVEALANEFFSGAGAREEVRTLFAVGDEKQSIYSFQGAAPEMFAAMGASFGKMAVSAGVRWHEVALNVSFRSVGPVLGAVDRVFARMPGVCDGAAEIRHIAKRFGHGGLIEIWPPERYAEAAPADAFSPLEEEGAALPVTRLADRIADTIKGWLSSGEQLVSEGRPIRPGDILILVRKRSPFAVPMIAALKARGIAVAGADRMRLAEQIAIQDLISLGDFLTLPEDDLALAEVLKSPLFDLDDDDLLRLAHGRKGTLWKALLDNAEGDVRFAAAAATLKRWRKAADFAPPYEFYARLLDADGVRARLISRLGLEAADSIDEFENLALTYDDRAPPSLSGFLDWLREENREIKRDMDVGGNEVRVMTVHGAKGLEAPIVFLPDTCSTRSAMPKGGRPIPLSEGARVGATSGPFVWPVKGTGRAEAIRTERAGLDEAERDERNRLLYVAMTRARDRLYVAGFEGKTGREKDCWYDLIIGGLGDAVERVTDAAGRSVLRLSSQQTAEPEPRKAVGAAHEPEPEAPAWALSPAPREPQLTVPLAPSRLAPYDTDEAGDPSPEPPARDPLAEPSAPSPAALADGNRFLRGTLTHALLEHLPAFDRDAWPRVAKGFIDARASELPAAVRNSIVAEALGVLAHPTFAQLFGTSSRAEVPIVAVLPRPRGAGPALRIAGQIDRLVELEREVLIVDYKTNRRAPRAPADVAPVYVYQLAAYRLALAEIFKEKTIRALLLWTDGARIMELPASLLDSYASRLWDLDPSRLDA